MKRSTTSADDPRVAAPRLVADEPAEPTLGRYRRTYRLDGSPGALLVQQVCAEVCFLGAGERLVTFRNTYGEYVRLGEDGAHRDWHDFDMRRDGWTRGAVERLLVRYAARGARAMGSGPFELVVHKRFTLGLGELEGVEMGGSRSAFGLMRHGPLHPALTELRLASAAGGEPIVVRLAAAFPGGRRATGRGWFTVRDGFRAEERFRHRYDARCDSFDDGGGYTAITLEATTA